MMRGLSTEFPWTELQRLQNFETAVKTAQGKTGGV